MKRKVLTENLWYFILKLIRKKPLFGFEIRDKIEKEFGFWVGNVTSYKVLYDLESAGYVSASAESYRKHYSMTKKGRAELRAAAEFLAAVAKK